MPRRSRTLHSSILVLTLLAVAGRSATAQPRAVTNFSDRSLIYHSLVPVTDPRSGEAAVVVSGDRQLWRVGSGGASALTSFEQPGPLPYLLDVAGGQLYFTSGPGDLWRSSVFDGTVAKVGDFTCLTGAASFEERLYFVGWTGEVEDVFAVNHLYRTDGGAVERLLRVPSFVNFTEIPPYCNYVRTAELDGRLVLTDYFRLLVTDGTEEGTHRPLLGTRAFCAAPFCVITELAALDGSLLVLESWADVSVEMWRSEGGDQDAERILRRDGYPGSSGAVAWDGRVFFSLWTPEAGLELWVTDGTADGTYLFADLRAGEQGSDPHELVLLGDRLYFTADDGLWGRELWVSDGTAAGTRRLSDIVPGTLSSNPQGLTPVGELLLFSADDGIHGREPWMSDGTPEGTLLIADLEAGPMPSTPSSTFTAAGTDVFWVATTGDLDTEVWTVSYEYLKELAASACPPDAGCLRGERFVVEVRWRDLRTGKEGVGHPLLFTDETVLFWFFDAENMEMTVKVLDGRSFNDHFWVFYGAMTDLEVWVTVTDTESGGVRVYRKPPGNLNGQADTKAFPAAASQP